MKASIISLLSLALTVTCQFNPDGEKNVGNGAGEQFITGQCLSNADCVTNCCAFISGGGICAAEAAALQGGKQGCGFGSGGVAQAVDANGQATGNAAGNNNNNNGGAAQNNNAGAAANNGAAANGNAAGKNNNNNGGAAQNNGAAAGNGAANANAGNNNAGNANAGNNNNNAGNAAAAGAATTAQNGGPPFNPAGVPNVGNGKGTQFTTGQCLSNADCQSGCCAGPSGICSSPDVDTQNGKTGCGFVAKRGLRFVRF